MKARLSGLAFLATAAVLVYLVHVEHLQVAKAIIGGPLLGATGLWLVLFGYPVRKDGLAPLWWRLGLLACVVGSTLAACVALE